MIRLDKNILKLQFERNNSLSFMIRKILLFLINNIGKLWFWFWRNFRPIYFIVCNEWLYYTFLSTSSIEQKMMYKLSITVTATTLSCLLCGNLISKMWRTRHDVVVPICSRVPQIVWSTRFELKKNYNTLVFSGNGADSQCGSQFAKRDHHQSINQLSLAITRT